MMFIDIHRLFIQTRISEELQNADVMLKRMKNSASNDNFGTPSPAYRSVHDKFAGMVKRDGSMNTYRVKSQLEQQQKIQNQVTYIRYVNYIVLYC